jgi:hypothetical protein
MPSLSAPGGPDLAPAPALAAGKKITLSIEGLKYHPDSVTIELATPSSGPTMTSAITV